MKFNDEIDLHGAVEVRRNRDKVYSISVEIDGADLIRCTDAKTAERVRAALEATRKK